MAAMQILAALDPRGRGRAGRLRPQVLGRGAPSPATAEAIQTAMAEIEPFGSTALHDALDQAAQRPRQPRRGPARGGRAHRRRRHRQPATARRGDRALAGPGRADLRGHRGLAARRPAAPSASPGASGRPRPPRAAPCSRATPSCPAGAAFTVSDFGGLQAARPTASSDELKHQYRLGYDPPPGPPRFRRIEVRSTRKGVVVQDPQRLRAAVVSRTVRATRARRTTLEVCMRVRIVLPLLIAAVAAVGLRHQEVRRARGRRGQPKVDTLTTEVEKTQERVKRNEVRIDEVDQEAQAGIAEAKGSAEQALVQGHRGREGGQGQAHLHGHPVQRQGHLPRQPRRGRRRRQGADRRGHRAAEGGEPGRVLRDRGPHRLHRPRRPTT